LVKELAHYNWFDATHKIGQSQKPNGTKDASNGPWEMTHGNMES
jgi:hypothetical protein